MPRNTPVIGSVQGDANLRVVLPLNCFVFATDGGSFLFCLYFWHDFKLQNKGSCPRKPLQYTGSPFTIKIHTHYESSRGIRKIIKTIAEHINLTLTEVNPCDLTWGWHTQSSSRHQYTGVYVTSLIFWPISHLALSLTLPLPYVKNKRLNSEFSHMQLKPLRFPN